MTSFFAFFAVMMFSLVFLCSGDAIPYVEYTETEINTWRTIYNGLIKQHKKWACSEYLRNFRQLEEKGLYSPDAIPQLQDVSVHLKSNFSIPTWLCLLSNSGKSIFWNK